MRCRGAECQATKEEDRYGDMKFMEKGIGKLINILMVTYDFSQKNILMGKQKAGCLASS
jgi:hypothetical protein